MSDIGLNFPLWFVFGMVLVFALPVTSLVLAGLGVGWFASRRSGRMGRVAVLKWSAIAVAPFWLVGAGFGLWMLTEELSDNLYQARHHSTLDTASVIDGIAIPAGATVLRAQDGALQTVDLAEGTTLAANGATWRGHVEFAPPSSTPHAGRGQIATGTLAAAVVIQGIPCQGEHTADFLLGIELRACTLSTDAAVSATINDDRGGTRTQAFICRAGAIVELQGVKDGELESCILQEPAEIGAIACASGAKIRLWSGALDTCTLAQPARFGSIDLPPGSTVTYYDSQPSRFALAADAGDLPAFGLALPGGTEGGFCYKTEQLDRLTVGEARYVVIGGVKLTRVEFDCGAFRSGTLFEDSVLRGKTLRRGEPVSRDDLFPPTPG
jgi:hypothetical protein